MNRHRIAALIAVPAAGAALLLGAGGIANAATLTPVSAPTPAPATYSEGAVNIDLTITNNTDNQMTLTWSGLTGSLDHWDKRPLATLPAHTAEEITGYSHNMTADLDMAMTYETGTGDLASFAVQTDPYGQVTTTTGTVVTQDNGQPATDLATASTTSNANPNGTWDYAVATISIGPAD